MKKILLFSLLLLLSFPAISFAHGGRTDSSGGHYDRSTGEYHYHHGYSAHQHPNGICPYGNNDATGNNSASSSSSTASVSSVYPQTPIRSYDDGLTAGYQNGYDEGYDIGYDEASAAIEEKYHVFLVTGIVFTTALGIVVFVKSHRNASRENRTISQLTAKRKEEERLLSTFQSQAEQEEMLLQNKIKSLQESILALEIEKHKIENINFEKYKWVLQEIQETLFAPHGYTLDDDDTFDYLIPEGVVIEKGYPRMESPDPVCGDSFFVYMASNSTIYHTKICRYYHNTVHQIHISTARKYYQPCSICKPISPDLEWYEEYLSLHRMKSCYEERIWNEPDYDNEQYIFLSK